MTGINIWFVRGIAGYNIALLLGTFLPSSASADAPMAEQAASADRFVDSIGVNTHWNYPDTPYGASYGSVKKLLLAAGIRHVRGDFSKARDLAQSGVTTMVSLDPGHNLNGDAATIETLKAKVKAANAGSLRAIDWVEGPNEPDLFWPKSDSGDRNGYGAMTYKGQGYRDGNKGIIAGTMAFQKDLYDAFKADLETRNLTIIGPALGKTYGYDTKSPFPNGSLTSAVDYGNFHPYPGGNPFSDRAGYDTIDWYIGHGTQPSANMDEFKYAFDIYAPPFSPKPMACSETGYSTVTDGPTEAVQAKYIPRLFCEYFNHGIVRTYLYEFVDAFANPTDRDSNFGLVRHDLTPKPSYAAVKNLIALLADKTDSAKASASFTPGTLSYSLAVQPVHGYKEPGSGEVVDYDRTQYVHHLLLQKRNGDFYLLLWHEIADEDGSVHPHRVITPPALPATITLPASFHAATVYLPNESMMGKTIEIVNGKFTLDVPDKVMVIRLTRVQH